MSQSYAPHQQRVIDEKTQLADRLEKLKAFIASNPLFEDLAEIEQDALRDQADAMQTYLDILVDRISRF